MLSGACLGSSTVTTPLGFGATTAETCFEVVTRRDTTAAGGRTGGLLGFAGCELISADLDLWKPENIWVRNTDTPRTISTASPRRKILPRFLTAHPFAVSTLIAPSARGASPGARLRRRLK